MLKRNAFLAAAVALATSVSAGLATSASPTPTRTNLISGAHLQFGVRQSNNWSGYNKSVLEKRTLFHEVSATWTVPTATQATSGQAEDSATWVGIGGGCIDSNCLVTDQTLIQAGTEQDVDANGNASYGAWWEIIPLPQLHISMSVSPGNRVHVDVSEGLPELWTITIQNLSTGATFKQLVPYPSSHLTAEWILETPLVVGNGGFSAMPNLSTVVFDPGTLNHGAPNLTASEAIQLVDGSGRVLATPSAPDGDADGFADCTYATGCGANGS